MEVNIIVLSLIYAFFIAFRVGISKRLEIISIFSLILSSLFLAKFSLGDLFHFTEELPFKVSTLFLSSLIVIFESVFFFFKKYKLRPGIVFFLLIMTVSCSLESVSLMSFCMALGLIGLILEDFGHSFLLVFCTFLLISRERFSDVIAFVDLNLPVLSILIMGILTVLLQLKARGGEEEEYLVSKVLMISVFAQLLIFNNMSLEPNNTLFYLPTLVITAYFYKRFVKKDTSSVDQKWSSLTIPLAVILMLGGHLHFACLSLILDLPWKLNLISLSQNSNNLLGNIFKIALGVVAIVIIHYSLDFSTNLFAEGYFIVSCLVCLNSFSQETLNINFKKLELEKVFSLLLLLGMGII